MSERENEDIGRFEDYGLSIEYSEELGCTRYLLSWGGAFR
jgi:hypothetical protein